LTLGTYVLATTSQNSWSGKNGGPGSDDMHGIIYVKSQRWVGGVGYEAMIVTGELVRDLGTAKFVVTTYGDIGASDFGPIDAVAYGTSYIDDPQFYGDVTEFCAAAVGSVQC